MRRRTVLPAALLAAATLLGAVPAASQTALTPAERAVGWRSLFDGATLRGWRGLGQATVPAGHWTVERGAIHKLARARVPRGPDGRPPVGGDIMTAATFGDFELTWEWRVSPGANTGVKYNVSESLSTSTTPTNAAKGFEYQIIDDDRNPDGTLPRRRTGALFDVVSPSRRARTRPVGAWNRSRIVLRGNHGEHWLNGVRVAAYDLGTPAMRAALGASKYQGLAWFAERRHGHVVLQDHDDEVWFRELRIRELPAPHDEGR